MARLVDPILMPFGHNYYCQTNSNIIYSMKQQQEVMLCEHFLLHTSSLLLKLFMYGKFYS